MKRELIAVSIFITFFTLFLFRNYVVARQVPLPYNLLVSFYSPWKFEDAYKTIPNKPIGFDNLKLFIPFRTYTTDSLKHGQIPLWNPFVFSGNVHLASYQTAIFYPLSLLYLLLPLEDAWTLLTMIQPLLVGIGMYMFLRSLNRSRQASFMSSLGFAFSGWMITNWQEVHVQIHTILYLPYALYASLQLWKSNQTFNNSLKTRMLLLFALACTFSILGGFLQMSIYFFTLLGIWNISLLFQFPRSIRLNTLSLLFIIGILSLGMTAPQWLPALEAYQFSPRGVVDSRVLFETFLSPLWFIVTILIPDLWGNLGSYNYFSPLAFVTERTIWVALPILIFGLVGLLTSAASYPYLRFWKLVTLITASMGFAIPTSWIFYTLHIPIMEAAQPSRIFVIATLGFCILSSYGFDEYATNLPWKKIKHIFLMLAILLLSVSFILCSIALLMLVLTKPLSPCSVLSVISIPCGEKLLTLYMTVSVRNMVLPLGYLIVFWVMMKFFKRIRILIFATAVVILLFSSTYQAKRILYFSQREHAFPELPVIQKVKSLAGISRVTSFGEGHILRNFLTYYQIYSPDGYDALFPQWYGELLYSIKTKGIWTPQITRTDAELFNPGQGEFIEKQTHRLRIMELLGVKYVLESTYINPDIPVVPLPSNLFTLVWSDDKWKIYQYTNALPRAFLASNSRKTSSPQEQLDLLYDPTIKLSDTVILDGNTPDIPPSPQSVDSVTIDSYTPNKVTITTSSPYERVLVLSDTYAPGWKAFIDAKETSIFKANYALRAIFVPAGQHNVIFHYQPQSWRISIGISGISLFLFLLVVFRMKKDVKK